MKVVHVQMYDTFPWCGYDESDREVDWCNADGEPIGGEPSAPERSNCPQCLDAIMAYGARAMTRKLDLVEQHIAERKASR